MSIHDRFTGIADEAGASIDVQIASHRRLGWRTLELRSIDHQPLAALPPERLEQACRALQDAGLSAPVIHTRIGNGTSDIADAVDQDLREFELLARLAPRLQTRMLRVSSRPHRAAEDPSRQSQVIAHLGALTQRAADHGLMLVHENGAGDQGEGLDHALALLDAIPHPSFQLLLDVGPGTAGGHDVIAWLPQVWPRVAHVHVGDARLDSGSPARPSPAGPRDSRLAEGMSYLQTRGYIGLWSIEPSLAQGATPRSATAPEPDRAARYVDYARSAMALFEACARPTPRLPRDRHSDHDALEFLP